jgi:hypothetical protein
VVAAGCLDVVVEGARAQLPVVTRFYTYWAGAPMTEAARPALDELVARLGRVRPAARTLRRARAAFARRAADEARIPARLMPFEFCAAMRSWQATGWRYRDAPSEWTRIVAINNRVHRRDDSALFRGARFLRRHGASRELADHFERGSAAEDEEASLYADDPVLRAIEDALGSPP